MALGLLVLFGGSGLVVTDYDARVTLPGEEPAAAAGLVVGPLGRCRPTLARRHWVWQVAG